MRKEITKMFTDTSEVWDFVRRLNNFRDPLVFLFSRDFYFSTNRLPTAEEISNGLGISIRRAINSSEEIVSKIEALK